MTPTPDTQGWRRLKEETGQVGGAHYHSKAIQPIEYIMANGLDFCEGNVVKYVTRHAAKGGLDDLEKARHYLDKLIEVERERKEPAP